MRSEEKFTLILNSHSLTAFQECETRYMYSALIGIEGLVQKKYMEKGTIVAEWAQLYYYNKIKPRLSFERALINPMVWTSRIAKRLNVPSKEAFDVFRACFQYREHWKDETWVPLAVERGFSKVLYEDDSNLFIYEGRPDLVCLDNGVSKTLVVSDLKTQSQQYSYYQFNNQALGYLWNFEGANFVYNYIKFTKEVEFRREAFQFHQVQIDKWVSDTTEWYFRVKQSLQRNKFLQSLNCQSKWGLCAYHPICEQPRDDMKLAVIRSRFKTRKIYRSW